MLYTISQLVSDLMARLGETAPPSPSPIPGPADIIALRAASLLPEAGEKLLREASLPLLAEGEPLEATPTSRLMPCGLYAADIPLPDDFVRLVSASLEGWTRSVHDTVAPGDPNWPRQFSPEPGIAGTPSHPKAYLTPGPAGPLLRLIPLPEAATAAPGQLVPEAVPGLNLRIVTIPHPPTFHFPTPLYPHLLSSLTPSP